MKLVRKEPFGEWVSVYYSPEKTSPENILERLREKESKEAALVLPQATEKSRVRIAVENPVAGPGDVIEVTVRFPEGQQGRVSTSLPKGWDVPANAGTKPADAALIRLHVQSPSTAKPGQHELSFRAAYGKEEVLFAILIDLVPTVAPTGK